jgi:hypothetical protein
MPNPSLIKEEVMSITSRTDELLSQGLGLGEAIAVAVTEATHPDPASRWRTDADGRVVEA